MPATLARGVSLWGPGLEVVYAPLLMLMTIATVRVGVSAWRFRTQMS